MTILSFPDRRRAVRAASAPRRLRPAVALTKAALTLWLIPWLFWLSIIDALDDGTDGDDYTGGYD